MIPARRIAEVERPVPADDVLPVNDLRRSWLATSTDVRIAVASVLDSGWFIHGPQHDQFEAELATFVGSRFAAGVGNGTDALVIAMQAVGVGSRSVVATVANAGGYVSAAAAQIGARVVYVDVDPASLVMTPATLDRALGPDVDAVVVTHLYGNVADTTAIVEQCRPRGIRVIEDCAQAIGGRLGERRVGSLGDVATFSFYPTKNLGAAGDGGAITTDDPEIDATVRSLRQYGWAGRYTVTRGLGRNSRLDELQAAVLRVGLRAIDAIGEERRTIVARYRDALQGSGTRLVTGDDVGTVAHLAVVRTPDRESLRARFASASIATDVHYPIPDHRQVGLAPPARVTDLGETERAAAEIVTLPCFPGMTPDEIARVTEVLAAAVVDVG